MRRPTVAALFGCTSLVLMLAANASDLPDRSRAYGETSSQLSRSQISGTSRASPGTSTSSSFATNQVGILFLRGDGGDPKELQVENDTLVFIAVRDGSGRVYQNGYAVDVDPVIQESAGQIAVALFRASAGTPVPISDLPVPARKALSRFSETGAKPRVMFAQITSREDTAKVSDILATKILALDASARTANRTDMVDFVRSAMHTFGLKSDVCDNSTDARCNRLGIREAFAQIKHEEALRRLVEPR
jgi:hypothetical protein